MGRMIRVEEAARLIGMTVSTLRNKCHLKEIPHYKVNRLLYFDTEELDAWLRQCPVKTNANIQKIIYNN